MKLQIHIQKTIYILEFAEVIIDEKEEQKLLYEITTIPMNESGSGAIVWIIIGIILLIALIVIGFVIKAMRKKAGSKLDTIN